MKQEKIKHLEFIQNVITRMNQNSFMIKGWTITIVSALLALYASNYKKLFILIAVFPTFVFMLLDSYYLWQERKFRHLYNKIISKNQIEQIPLFSMNTKFQDCDCKCCYMSALFSITEAGFYFLIIIGLLVLYFLKF